MSPSTELAGKYPNIDNVFTKARQGFPHNLANRHEHLLRELDAAWGTAECVRLLEDPVFSDRPDRHGFTADVMMELFALKNHRDRLFPQFVANQFDPFAAVNLGEADDLTGDKIAGKAEKPSAIGPSTALPGARKRADESPAPAVKPVQPGAVASSNPATWPEIGSLDELREIQQRRAAGERLPMRALLNFEWVKRHGG